MELEGTRNQHARPALPLLAANFQVAWRFQIPDLRAVGKDLVMAAGLPNCVMLLPKHKPRMLQVQSAAVVTAAAAPKTDQCQHALERPC